jgi:hypothetical protein
MRKRAMQRILPQFEPEATGAMTEAFVKVCRELKLNGNAAVREAIAVRIIEVGAARRTRPGANSREGAPRSKARRSQASPQFSRKCRGLNGAIFSSM